jgi:hypothetical protein
MKMSAKHCCVQWFINITGYTRNRMHTPIIKITKFVSVLRILPVPSETSLEIYRCCECRMYVCVWQMWSLYTACVCYDVLIGRLQGVKWISHNLWRAHVLCLLCLMQLCNASLPAGEDEGSHVRECESPHQLSLWERAAHYICGKCAGPSATRAPESPAVNM